jgi:hypothetical protein
MTAAIGAVIGAVGQIQQARAAKKAEKARERQMNLDVQRKRREAVRQAMAARAMALNNATAQGASMGSGLAGGYGQIGGDLARNQVALSQDQQLGRQVFSANRQFAQAGTLVGIGQGISNASSSFDRMFGIVS